ncbi:MAG: hypothetical protein WEB31_07315 [Chthoniobacterales bacterium]
MSKITRRSFLITSASAIGSCFVPGWLLRRAADYAKTDGGIYLEAPESARNTLYAIEQSRDCFQFALNGRTDTLPEPFTWREYFQDHVYIDPDDHLDVRKWLREEGAFYFDRENLRYAYRHLHFLDDQIDDRIWENYLEGPYAVYGSPEAQALHYLAKLPLSNGTGTGDPLGDLKFYYGTMPGADWHFVNAEGPEVLTALQHRLRELGESTKIVVVK